MYCLSAGPSRILEGSANRVGEPFAVGGVIRFSSPVRFTMTLYLEQDGQVHDCFQHDQIVESELHKDNGHRPDKHRSTVPA